MESHAPALELGEGENMPDLALPPHIDEYVPLQAQQYRTSPNGQLDRDTRNMIASHSAHVLPSHSKVSTMMLVLLSH